MHFSWVMIVMNYRLSPKKKKVIRSRDFVFREDKTFVDTGKDKEIQNVDIIPDPIPTPSPLPHNSDVQDVPVKHEVADSLVPDQGEQIHEYQSHV